MATMKKDRLNSLFKDAYTTCVELRDFTRDNFYVFEGDDDDKIIEFVQDRQGYLSILSDIENEIDLIYEEAEDYKSGDRLPSEIADIRLSIRAVLDEIGSFDIEAIKRVSGKMHQYKVQTMKARSRKHISSYYQSEALTQTNVEYTK